MGLISSKLQGPLVNVFWRGKSRPIKMTWQRHKELAEKEELEAPVWPIPLKNDSSGDLAVVKFFEEQP